MSIEEAMRIYGEWRAEWLTGSTASKHSNSPELFQALTVLADRFYTTSKAIERITGAHA